MLLSANFALRAALGDPVLPDMDLLRDDVDTAWSLAHDSSYEQLAKLLQTLIPRLESAARAGTLTHSLCLFGPTTFVQLRYQSLVSSMRRG